MMTCVYLQVGRHNPCPTRKVAPMSTRLSHRIVSVIMSLALVISTTPCPALARTESDAVPRWSDEIPELLSAGEYVEGEALVGIIGTSDETALSTQEGLPGDDVEAIMTVEGKDVLAGSVTDESGTITTQSELDSVTLSVVTSSSMSTEELLYALAQDDRVAFAEPNYLTTLTEDEALEGDDTDPAGIEPDENAVAEATDEALADEGAADVVASDPTAPTDEQEFVIGSNSADDTLLPQAEVSVADLTPLQWSNSNATTVRTSAMNNQSPSHSANIPSFGATGSNMDREVRVAVFDGSVDHTNPDLSNVVYHFSADEMQALGCGEWAYNATNAGGQDSSAFAPTNHATHCAGIIGAEWDGKGISGAASKARIVSVQVMDAVPGKGWIKYESLLRGYAFVDAFNKHCTNDADKIRVCSLSIGTFQTSRAIDAAVRAVGADHGTVSVFSAGNQSTDNDTIVRTSSTLRQNPYALVVASIDTAGNLSAFSSWGAQTVTLASPGTGILSTVNTGSAAYFPDAALGTDGTILYEGFEGSTYNFGIEQINYDVSQRVSPDCNLTSGNQPRFAGNHAILVPVDPNLCNKTDSGNIAYFLLTLDVADCMSRLTSSSNIQFGIAFSGKGDSVKMDCVQDSEGTKLPIKRNDDGSTGGWSDTAVNLSGATVSGGKLTLILSIIVDKDTQHLAMDSIGIGTSDVPYAVMDGTSMATPLVAGCTAVYAARHPGDNGTQLAARVRASVTKTSQMANITSTGGIIDLANDVEGTVEEVSPVTPTFPLYEDTLPLTTSTGENPFAMDTIGDLETYGKLAELNGALYYFPAWGTVTTTSSAVAFPYHNMFVFDLASGTWDENRTGRLPQVVLANMSVCTYDGKLWVVGGEGEVIDNLPYVNPAGAAHVYSFDPASNQWTEHNATGMSLWADLTIFADKDGLKILDAGESDKSSSHVRNASIRSYDPATGMGNTIASFEQPIKTPLVAVHDDTTYIIDNTNLRDTTEGLTVWTVKGESITTISASIPKALVGDRASAGLDALSYADQNSEINASLLAGKDALYLVGHTDTNKSGDTWSLAYGSTEFKPYGKHLASTRPVQTTAAMYQGKIYAMASAWGEQDGRTFRATKVEDVAKPIVFSDVDSTNPDESKRTPHYQHINWLAAQGISTGWYDQGTDTYTFRGEWSVQRQDMAAFLRRLAKSLGADVSIPEGYQNPFCDVFPPNANGEGGTPHYEDILWLASTGISEGWKLDDGRAEFRGSNPVVRQDMAAFLRRLAKKLGVNVEVKEGMTNIFSDVYAPDAQGKGGTPHYEDIVWLASTGVTTGWPMGDHVEFRGMNEILRQDMAAFLHRLYDHIEKERSA